jgi:hypothetical protein
MKATECQMILEPRFMFSDLAGVRKIGGFSHCPFGMTYNVIIPWACVHVYCVFNFE